MLESSARKPRCWGDENVIECWDVSQNLFENNSLGLLTENPGAIRRMGLKLSCRSSQMGDAYNKIGWRNNLAEQQNLLCLIGAFTSREIKQLSVSAPHSRSFGVQPGCGEKFNLRRE
ncbi:hypothetical protein TNCV_1081431 [Trichonephila clavipes]|nr:hypothetical protein TNCV_1081431 [Trichonephila clavipes]